MDDRIRKIALLLSGGVLLTLARIIFGKKRWKKERKLMHTAFDREQLGEYNNQLIKQMMEGDPRYFSDNLRIIIHYWMRFRNCR